MNEHNIIIETIVSSMSLSSESISLVKKRCVTYPIQKVKLHITNPSQPSHMLLNNQPRYVFPHF